MGKIMITGGTGLLGSEIVRQLSENDHTLSVLSTKEKPDVSGNVRVFRGDLTNRESLEIDPGDVEVIIHCASNPVNYRKVDVEGTRNLLSAVNRENIKHLVYISIVGVDKSNYPYYEAKLETEKLIIASGFPYTILRATQFHDLVLNRLILPADKTGDSVIRIPSGMRFQSIDIKDITGKIVNLALNDPTNSIVTAGGPEISSLEEMTKSYLEVIKTNKQIITDPDDESFPSFKSGINLCPGHIYGKTTWKAFLKNTFNA